MANQIRSIMTKTHLKTLHTLDENNFLKAVLYTNSLKEKQDIRNDLR